MFSFFQEQRLLTIAQYTSPDSATEEVCELYGQFRRLMLTLGYFRAFTVLHVLARVPESVFPAFSMRIFLLIQPSAMPKPMIQWNADPNQRIT